MKLITEELRKKIPAIYTQEESERPVAYAKFFTPDSYWTWYVMEFDGDDLCFGLVHGHEEELGYFSLSELESVKGKFGLGVERDLYFKPTEISELKKKGL